MDEALNRAIGLIRTGQKTQARPILEDLIKANPQNLPAWFWYVETCDTQPQRIQVLEACLRANPGNPQAQQALDTIESKQYETTGTSTEDPASPIPFQSAEEPADSFSASQEKTGEPLPAPQGNTLTRGMWALSILLISLVAAGGFYLMNTMPPSPNDNLYSEPSEYYLYVPKGYTEDREWPVFVGIHGSGGSGRDCWNWWQSYADNEGFILVCPSFADASGGWVQREGETKLIGILNQVARQYQTEPQVYIAGFSAGATFAEGYAFNYPRFVKGAAVLSPGQNFTPSQNARGIPFLVVIGDLDAGRRLNATLDFVSALEQENFDVEYHELAGVGHTLTRDGRNLTIDHFRDTQGN